MDGFIGTWEVVDIENFDEILEVLGLEEEMQKVMKINLPKLEYSRSGETWTQRIITPVATKEYAFTSGQELDSMSIDGRPVKCMISIEGNKFVEHYKTGGEIESTVVRELHGDQLVVTVTCKGVKSTARHKKV